MAHAMCYAPNGPCGPCYLSRYPTRSPCAAAEIAVHACSHHRKLTTCPRGCSPSSCQLGVYACVVACKGHGLMFWICRGAGWIAHIMPNPCHIHSSCRNASKLCISPPSSCELRVCIVACIQAASKCVHACCSGSLLTSMFAGQAVC